jgi:hypothetical protein
MGRGLSDLQRRILVIAHDGRGTYGTDSIGTGYDGYEVDVTRDELFIRLFGYAPKHPRERHVKERGDFIAFDDDDPSDGGFWDCTFRWRYVDWSKSQDSYRQKFLARLRDRDEHELRAVMRANGVIPVDPEKHNSHTASLSRALKRLHGRGLIVNRHVAKLTPWGMYVAYRLKTDKPLGNLATRKFALPRNWRDMLTPEQEEERHRELMRIHKRLREFANG